MRSVIAIGRYRVSCVSMRDALSGGFLGGWAGFEIADLAADCLHPSHGRLGTEYLPIAITPITVNCMRNEAD